MRPLVAGLQDLPPNSVRELKEAASQSGTLAQQLQARIDAATVAENDEEWRVWV